MALESSPNRARLSRDAPRVLELVDMERRSLYRFKRLAEERESETRFYYRGRLDGLLMVEDLIGWALSEAQKTAERGEEGA